MGDLSAAGVGIRRFVLLSAAIGTAIGLIGFAWAVHDPVSASSFLPASVRDAGYFKHEPIPAGLMAPTAAGIFMNNIIVSFYVFAGGITFGLWTLYAIYQNSMLLGVLSGLTNRDGFNSEYWSLIVPHGVIELTSLAITAGAGLTLADALIRARDEPRRVVLRRNAQRGALVVAGTISGPAGCRRSRRRARRGSRGSRRRRRSPSFPGVGALLEQLARPGRRRPRRAGRPVAAALPGRGRRRPARGRQHPATCAEPAATVVVVAGVEGDVALPDRLVQHGDRAGRAEVVVHRRRRTRPARRLGRSADRVDGPVDEAVDPGQRRGGLGQRGRRRTRSPSGSAAAAR